MTDVLVVLGANGLAARVFLDGLELSGLMSFSLERGLIDRVELSIAPTQLLVVPAPPEPRKAIARKRAKKSKTRRGRR